MSDVWVSDTTISLPEPVTSDRPVQVDFGGFAFTTGGLCHNLTDADREDILSTCYMPKGARPA